MHDRDITESATPAVSAGSVSHTLPLRGGRQAHHGDARGGYGPGMEWGTGPGDAFVAWFHSDYPVVVGVAHRVLAGSKHCTDPLAAAQIVTQAAFAGYSGSRPTEDGDADLTVVLRRVLDTLWRRTSGGESTAGRTGESTAGRTMATEPGAMTSARPRRRRDRHLLLLCRDGGYTPAQAAVLLELPLDQVLSRWARLCATNGVGITQRAPGVPGAVPDRDALLARSAKADPDLDAALSATVALVGGRRRRRLALTAGSALILLLVILSSRLSLPEGDRGPEVAADADAATSAPASSSTVSSPEPVPSVTLPPSSRVEAPETTDAPVDSVPAGTTVAGSVPSTRAVEPLHARFEVLTGHVAAGDTARVEVAWSVGDLPAEAPDVIIDWGDPVVQAAPRWPHRCEGPAKPSQGSVVEEFRYTTPGLRPLRITVQTCGGDAAGGQTVSFDAHIDVTPPAPPDPSGRAERVTVLTTDSEDPGVDLGTATLTFHPFGDADDPEAPPLPIGLPVGADAAAIAQRVGRRPARVVTVPAVAGRIELLSEDGTCRADASLDANGPAVVLLSPRC